MTASRSSRGTRPGARSRRAPGLPGSGPLAIVYTDIGGSTALTERLGDARARRLLRAHDREVRRTTERHRGVELRALGDGFMLAFPGVAEAVAFAVELQDALAAPRRAGSRTTSRAAPVLAVRIGIHFGEPIRERGEFFGSAMILGQRIMARAEPGTIFASEPVSTRAPSVAGFRWLRRGLYHLKGIARPVPIFELAPIASAPVATADASEPRVAAVRPAPSPFVGRDEEMRALELAFDAAASGSSRFLALIGDAGIGKTRLAREFVSLVEPRGAVSALGRCHAELAVPLKPLLDALDALRGARPRWSVPRPLRGDLAPLATLAPTAAKRLLPRRSTPPAPSAREPGEQRTRLLAALAVLVVEWSRREPIVLVLDDLQWADAHTLDALRVLARHLAAAPRGRAPARLLVVACCRGDEVAADSALAGLFADLDRDHLLDRIRLHGLERGEIDALVRELAGVATPRSLQARIFERSHGNPYFAEELVRDLAETGVPEPGREDALRVPERIQAVVERRLARLSPRARELVQIASLLGSRFSYESLAATVDLEPEALAIAFDEALAAKILREEILEDAYACAFEHDLVAEAVRSGFHAPRRAARHLAVATRLEHFYGERALQHAFELARHFAEAGPLAPVASVYRYAAAAGDTATAAFAAVDAARLYEAALDALSRIPETSEAERAELEHKLAVALGRTGSVDRAHDLADRAIARFERIGALQQATRTRADIAGVLALHARPADALPYLEAALAALGNEQSTLAGTVLAQYAVALDLTGDAELVHSTATRLLRLGRRMDDPELVERGLVCLRNWYANHTSQVGRALALSDRYLASVEKRADLWGVATALENAALFRLVRGRVGEALDLLDQALAMTERLGLFAKIIDVRALRAMCFCYRGEWSRVEDEWGRAEPLLGRVPGALRIGQLLWARVRRDLWLERPMPDPPRPQETYPGISQFQISMLAVGSLVATERRDPAAAKALASVAACHPADGAGVNWLMTSQAIAAACANLGDADAGERWHAPLVPYRGTLLLTCTAYELSRLSALSGKWQRSATEAGAAIGLARREALRPFLALALVQQGEALRHLGRSPRRALDEAGALFRALGMRDASVRADAPPPG